MRRLLALVATSLLWAVAIASPASAQANDEPGVYFTSPAAGKTLTGTATIEAYAVPDKGLLLGLGSEQIESITVTISPRASVKAPAPITKPGEQFSAGWNTSSLTPYNGVYDLAARVNSNRSEPATATLSNLKVNNPPAVPTGVSATLTGAVPVVSWKANSEPDITGYRVLRAAASGSFEQIASVEGTKFTDAKAPVGLPLRYQIVAVRYSPVSQSGVTAKSSSSSPVTIPAPEKPAGEGGGEPTTELPEDVFIPETTTAEPAPAPPPPPPPAPSAPLAPIIRSEPLAETGVDFAEQLPFDGPLPEQFNADGGSDTGSGLGGIQSAADSGEGTVSSPVKFMAAGLVLLTLSILLARISRKLLKAKPDGDGSKPPKVQYPTFKVSRTR